MAWRKRKDKIRQAAVEGEWFLGAGWFEDDLGTIVEGAFQTPGFQAVPADHITFFAIDRSGSQRTFPFTSFDWVRLEPRSELPEGVAEHHAGLLGRIESPSLLMGYVSGIGLSPSGFCVILPMEGTNEEWVELFALAGVKVLKWSDWVEWDAAAWTQDHRDRLDATLDDRAVPHRWRGDALQSGGQNRDAISAALGELGLD